MLIGKDISDWEYYAEQIRIITCKINERVDEIYNNIFTLFDVKNKISYKMSIQPDNYNDCYECGGYGKPYDFTIFKNELIPIECNNYKYPKTMNIYYNNKIINLSLQLPTNWLILSFQQELNEGYVLYQNKLKLKHKETLASKDKTKESKLKLQKLIKSKLSPEELEMISFKKK